MPRVANDRFVLGLIGIGWPDGQGRWDAKEHVLFGDIAAIADVDLSHANAAKNSDEIGKGKADVYQDYRKLLDRKDIDVVCIATVDHWHVKIAIEALQAGKHVFCQKPLTFTLEENQLIRNACKRFDKQVCCVGTQQRGDRRLFLRAVNMVRKGLLGQIKHIHVGVDGNDQGGPFKKAAVPKELDWNMWQGQTDAVDYIPERCHHQFRWWYEYTPGHINDWGAHHMDIALWAIDRAQLGTGPVEIDGTKVEHPWPMKDGYPTVHDCYTTAKKFTIEYKFADGLTMTMTSEGRNGIVFQGAKGRIFVNRGRIEGTPIQENWDAGKFDDADVTALCKGKQLGDGPALHKANFYRCIREGGQPISDVFSHVMAMNACHTAGIAARLQRVIKWDPQQEKIIGDDQAAAFFAHKARAGFEVPRV